MDLLLGGNRNKPQSGFNIQTSVIPGIFSPSSKLGAIKLDKQDQENESPQKEKQSSPFLLKPAVNGIVKYQKRDSNAVAAVEETTPSDSNWNSTMKAKRLKKLASELPDLGGAEDILKFQEELTQTKTELITLRELSESKTKEMELIREENARLLEQNKTLSDQVSLQQTSKEAILTELAEKSRQHHVTALERDLIAKQLSDYSNKLNGFEEKVKSSESIQNEQKREMQQLQHTLEEVKEDKDISKSLLERSENNVYKLKQKYFFSCALALKLNAQLSDRHYNGDLTSLYEQAIKEQVPYEEWHKWLLNRMFN
ncbi:Viral A-type inclusion protein repeat [Planoprotostelium fungivorum]|uniref:Viral A-type inclusion protein repeat n=1 Tax=Planoprotostelium fungivorum TaxID=1890364 RepID=A0A2P6N447_9EUKA|nr:Viral A-type inclusion protein repeat [Planoprotostelium fungivorum]